MLQQMLLTSNSIFLWLPSEFAWSCIGQCADGTVPLKNLYISLLVYLKLLQGQSSSVWDLKLSDNSQSVRNRKSRIQTPALLSLERENLRCVLYILPRIPRKIELQSPTEETYSFFMHPGWAFPPSFLTVPALSLELLEITS